MEIDLALTGRAPDIQPKAAYAWWTDYREDDHGGPAFRLAGWKRREILEHDDEGRVLRFRDPGGWLGVDHSYTSLLAYDDDELTVHESSEGPIGPFTATYRFMDDGEGGTLLVWRIKGEVRPTWAKYVARVPGIAELLARHDLDAHLLEMRAELGR